jgi:hypothetical protein
LGSPRRSGKTCSSGAHPGARPAQFSTTSHELLASAFQTSIRTSTISTRGEIVHTTDAIQSRRHQAEPAGKLRPFVRWIWSEVVSPPSVDQTPFKVCSTRQRSIIH